MMILSNDDLSFIKLLLIAKGGRKGKALAKRISIDKRETVIERTPKPYRTEPDHPPRECVHGIHSDDYCYLCERIVRNTKGADE